MKKFGLLATLFLLLSICSFQCDDEPVQACGDNLLKFEISLNISPSIDTIYIGDTLWLEMTIPEYLANITSNEDVLVLDHDFKAKHGLNRMDADGTPRAYHEFEYTVKIGHYERFNIGSGGEFASITTDQVNGEQNLQIGLIPLSVGLFQMDFYKLSKDLNCQPLPALGSDQNTLELTYKMNNGDLEGNNYPMLLASPIATTSPELISAPDVFLKAGVYIFQVLE